MNPEISIVIPCFNEEEAIPFFYEETLKVLRTMSLSSFEFVFIDDGSSDRTLEVLKEISAKDKSVHFVSFSRNFGKEAALYAGLSKANGEFISVMDVDLQDPPSLLPQMLEAILKEGYDCAATRRVTRKNEPPVRSFFARKFYKIMGKLSDVPVVDGARDFRLMTRKYKDAVLSLLERNRFTKGIFPWVGFKTKWFAYENVERVAGKTKWSFWKLFLYSIDGIIGFSTKPLAFFCGGRCSFSCGYFCTYHFYCCQATCIWRPGTRLGKSRMLYNFLFWLTVILYRNQRSLHLQSLYGSKTKTNLYYQGGKLK